MAAAAFFRLVVAAKPEHQLRDGVLWLATAADNTFPAALAGFAKVARNVQTRVFTAAVAFRAFAGLFTVQALSSSHTSYPARLRVATCGVTSEVAGLRP